MRLGISANDAWHDQSHPYVPNSAHKTTSLTQNENIVRRYHSQQGDILPSPMSDRPIFERATSDPDGMASKHSLSIAHTLGLGENVPPYRIDSSQSTLHPRKSLSRSASLSASADDIQNGIDAIYDMDAANRIKKSSGMAGDASTMSHGRERTSRRSKSIDLYHPSVGQPLNPRDHSLLERIYNEMHADRFINLMPLSLFAMTLEMLYTRELAHQSPGT